MGDGGVRGDRAAAWAGCRTRALPIPRLRSQGPKMMQAVRGTGKRGLLSPSPLFNVPVDLRGNESIVASQG